MNQMCGWDLIVAGRFDEACSRADLECSETSSLLPLRNKVCALLHLKKFGEASSLCQTIIDRRNGDTDTDFILYGVSEWLLGNHESALTAWRNGMRTKYTDAAGGVEIPLLIFFAAINTQDKVAEKEAVTGMRRTLKSSKTGNWPAPLERYVLGDISEASLQTMISGQQTLRSKQLCQAAFQIACNHFAQGDMKVYREKLDFVLQQGLAASIKPEYHLAMGELCKQ